MDPIAEFEAELRGRGLQPKTVDIYMDAVRRLSELYPDPVSMPSDAMMQLGDTMMRDDGNPGTVNVSLSGVRQWAAWLRAKGRPVPELRSPPKNHWSKPPTVVVPANENASQLPAPEASAPPPAPAPAPMFDADALAAKRIMDRAARAEARKQGGTGGGGPKTISAGAILPLMSSISVWLRSPDTGRMVHRGDYNGRDLNGATSIEGFLEKWVAPKLPPSTPRGYEFEVIETMPNGQQRKYTVELPTSEDEDMSANGTAAEIGKLRASLDIDAQVERASKMMGAMREIAGGDQGGGFEGEMLAMLRMKMSMKIMAEVFRDFDGPPPAPPMLTAPSGPDPVVLELRAELKEIRAELARSREGGGIKDAVLLASALQAPMIEVMKLRDGSKGGLGAFTETIGALKSLGIKIGSGGDDDGGELVKLTGHVAAIVGSIKDLKALPAPKAAAAADAPVPLPPGFAEACAKLTAATESKLRVGAAAELLEMLAKSGDSHFVSLLLWLRERSVAAVAEGLPDAQREAIYTEMMGRIDPIVTALASDKHFSAETAKLTIEAFREWIGPITVAMSTVKPE